MSRDVDLSSLRMEQKQAVRKPLGPRLAAGVVLLVLVGLVVSFVVPLLAPVREVATAAVRIAESGSVPAGVTVAEAAGWIEPDPFPTVVRPLVSGVLVELRVLEGDTVKKGETIIGRIESASLLAKRDAARARLALRVAQLAQAETKLQWARALLDQKADVREAEAGARHHISITRGRIDAAKAGVHTAQAGRDRAAAELEGQQKLQQAGGTYPVALAKARASLATADAVIRQRESELATLETELRRDMELHSIAKEVLADPRALKERTEQAETARDSAVAEHAEARVAFEVAERESGWCEVRAPIDGIVLKLLAAPGSNIGPGGHGMVTLYDPKRLQARIDVPLASVANVAVGQRVDVRTEVVAGKATKGVVVRIQRESDLLKNTLQVKVRLIDPDPILRPETLCRARFTGMDNAGKKADGPTLFLVPKRAVRGGAVFVVAAGRARRIAVEQVGERGDSAVVKGALSPTQRVILDEIEDGERVK